MHDTFVALRIAAVALGLFWLLTRTALTRLALVRTMRHPALFVPAVMAGFVGLTVALTAGPAHLTEQPFFSMRVALPPALLGMLWFVVESVAIAGQVGLLEAIDAGRRPNGDEFRIGVVRHTATMLCARALIAAGLALLARLVPERSTPLIVLALLPSLFLVPIVGLASRHPGRPLRAIVATLSFARPRIAAVGGPLLAHGLLLLGLGTARHLFDHLDVEPRDVAFLTSGLGFNLGFFAAAADSPLAALVSCVASLSGTVVFTTAQWIGVRHGYDPASLARIDKGPVVA